MVRPTIVPLHFTEGRVAQIYHAEPLTMEGCPASRGFRDVGFSGRGPISLPAHELSTGELPVIQLYQTALVEGIVTITAPPPHLRRLHQPALHRVAMHVFQFLDPLPIRPNVEVIKASLPNVPECVLEKCRPSQVAATLWRQHPSSKTKLEGLHNRGRVLFLRLTDQQMNMFGHDHVAQHDKLITPSHLFQNSEKQVATHSGAQQRLSVITTEG